MLVLDVSWRVKVRAALHKNQDTQRFITYCDIINHGHPRTEVTTVGWGALRKIWGALYTVVLLVGLAVMISPLPEGTLLLSLLLSYFGYRLTGNLYVTGAIYVVTFLVTLVLIQKLHLIAKFKAQLEKLRGPARVSP